VSSKRVTQFELEHPDVDDPGVVILVPTGELDLTNAHGFEERMEGVISPMGGSSLVLDLTRLAFIDSAGLHVLFRTARRLSKERFGLVVEPASPIARTLEIVGISGVATLGGSVDDLLAVLSPA